MSSISHVWFTEGAQKNYLIRNNSKLRNRKYNKIRVKNLSIYTKVRRKLIKNIQKTALGKPRLNKVSDSASLDEMSNLFHISEQKLIEDQ